MRKIIGLLIVVVLFGCQDLSLLGHEPKSINDYSDLFQSLNKAKDGYLTIQCFNNFTSQSLPNMKGQIEGGFAKSAEELEVGEIEVNDISMTYGSRGYKSGNISEVIDLYGTTVNVKIKGEVASFYLSEVIKFKQYYDKVDVGTTIAWNADERNDIGVAIRIRYMPNHNPEFKDNYNRIVDNYIVAEDNGKYTLKAKDFEGIPPGATISVGMGRGGATVMELDGYKYSLMGISMNKVSDCKYSDQ
jgi:hypothetical protein